MDRITSDSMIVTKHPNYLLTEAFRCLRTCVCSIVKSEKIKVIGMTSATPNEGKTFSSINLAAITAQLGKKTLLADCDLRKQGLRRSFKLPGKTRGLSNVLKSRNLTLKNIPFLKTDEENLVFLSSGEVPRNPAELLESQNLSDFIELVRPKFDFIFFDMPPVLSITDSVVLGKKIDAVIIVSKAEQTPRKAIQKTYTTLKESGINVIGSVLNCVKKGTSGYYGYGYYSENQ